MTGKRTLLVAAVILCPALMWSQWYDAPPFHVCGAGEGSALCAGRCDLEPEMPGPSPYPRDCVWMLYGDREGQNINQFSRYDIAAREWAHNKARMDGAAVKWGGALAYVPDPFAYPPNGRVFSFTGNETPEFWSYDPAVDEWTPLEDVPEEVTKGGALCYGGTRDIGGINHAVLYAFSGQDVNFWRYTFPLNPRLRGGRGDWEQLQCTPGLGIDKGAALAWVPMLDNPEYPLGAVVAVLGGGNCNIYTYNVDADRWDYYHSTNHRFKGGAAIAADPDGRSVYLFEGGGKRTFLKYDAERQALYYSWPTPRDQNDGSALCQVGEQYYAEFGDGNSNEFWRFEPADVNGVQSNGGTGLSRVRVEARPGRDGHRFRVQCRPGPVAVEIRDCTGRPAARLTGTAESGTAVLDWNHGSTRSGVYLYSVRTSSGTATGKLVVAR